jgi:dimethylglycine dehydrogenase
MVGDDVVGTVTSGDWGYRIGKNLAYAFVKPEHSAQGTTFEVDVLGKRVPATIIPMGPYDPDYSLMRS